MILCVGNKSSKCFVFPGVPTNSSFCTRASNSRRKVHYQSRACDDLWGRSTWCSAWRILWGVRISPKETSFLILASRCWLSLQQFVTESKVVPFLNLESRGDRVSFSSGDWSLCVRESGCGSTEGSQVFTRAVVCGRWHQAILRRFRVWSPCKGFQFCRRAACWIRSCECAFS